MTNATKENLKNGGFWSMLLMFGAVIGLFGGKLAFQTEDTERIRVIETRLTRIEERLDQFINIYANLQLDVKMNSNGISNLQSQLSKQESLIERNTDDIKTLFNKVGM